MWYFVFADCSNVTVQRDETQMDIDISVMAIDNMSQFSYEEQGMISFYAIALIVFVIVLGASMMSFI